MPYGTTLTSGTVWLSDVKTAALAPITIGPITYAVPALNATTTEVGTLPMARNQSYLMTVYVTLENDASTPILFDNGTDLCRIKLSGDVQAADVSPNPPYWPTLTADLQFTNFPANATTQETTACVTMAYTMKDIPSPNLTITVSFTNRSGTMSWATATGGNPMVTASIVNVGQ